MCEAVEKLVKEEKERDMVSAVKHVSEYFNVSEEDAVASLGYSAEAYEKAKKNQGMML